MNCYTLCGYKECGHGRRPHFSCLFCRLRRFFYGKMDPKKYHYNRYMRVVMPQDCTNYILIIDNKRRFAKAKGLVLKKLLTIVEWLAN
jgi:hypothetical protein